MRAKVIRSGVWAWVLLAVGLAAVGAAPGQRGPKSAARPVSFHEQVHPILQRRCQGCHQPASTGGKLVLTAFSGLVKGGAHGAAIRPGKPEQSPLVTFISGKEP